MADNIATTPGSGATIAADDVGGVLHQRVKISVGADGAATDVSTAAPMPVDSEMAAAAALADGAANPTTASVGAAGLYWNGATWDRRRGNLEGTLLASAARTTSTSAATQTNYNARGVIVVLTITAASGTGGLTVRLVGSTNSNLYFLNAAPTAITATGVYAYELYPGAATAGSAGTGLVNQRTAAVLPRSWYAHIFVGDASSYTYQVDYSLIL